MRNQRRIAGVILWSLIAFAYSGGQTVPTGPITKANLLSALESMQSGKSRRQDAAWWVSQVKEHKVSFRLTSTDKRNIRQHGNYLGTKGLNSLITAIQQNPYRGSNAVTKKEPRTPSSINQAITNSPITNSPGSVQAVGSTVTINQGAQQRRLTSEQESLFIGILKDNPKGAIAVTCVENSGPEACVFARQLVGLLESTAAGWTVSFSPMLAWGDPKKTIPELYVLVKDSKNPPVRAAVLQTALKAVGHNAVGIERSDLPSPDFVQLTVSTKQPE